MHIAAQERKGEQGFVLATSLVMLLLLTMLAVGAMYSGTVAQQTSSVAQKSTQAFYYAETAIHYMTWALANDADFDGVNPSSVPANASSVGDASELFANLSDPGPITLAGVGGQVRYFDNRALNDRNGITWSTGGSLSPSFANISTILPRYIKLEISVDGSGNPVVSPSMPALNGSNIHGTTPGTDVPVNGAVVWITAGIEPTPGAEPVDAETWVPTSLATSGTDCMADALCPCNGSASAANDGQICYTDAGGTSGWVDSYSIVAYAIGYVDGKAVRMIRAAIM